MIIKSMLTKAYGDCEGPLGLPMKSHLAKELETILKGLPQECREAGLKRVSVTPKIFFDEDARTDISVVTNEAIDRDNEVIIASGLYWKQFEKGGGPVMFAHDYTMLPVGKSQWVVRIRQDEKAQNKTTGWRAQTFYHTRPKSWDGAWLPDAVVSMLSEDGLKGKSIGFIPSEFSSPTKEEIIKRPELVEVSYIIRKAIVIEYSVAAVPSNPEAIAGGKSYSKDLTSKCLEHMGIYLPTGVDDYETEIKSESSCVDEIGNYKVVNRLSNAERMKKALEKM